MYKHVLYAKEFYPCCLLSGSYKKQILEYNFLSYPLIVYTAHCRFYIFTKVTGVFFTQDFSLFTLFYVNNWISRIFVVL